MKKVVESINEFMIGIFGKSWRTAIIGYLMALYVACWPIIQNSTFNWHTDWKNLVGAAFIALFASKTKDAAVTGLPANATDPNAIVPPVANPTVKDSLTVANKN